MDLLARAREMTTEQVAELLSRHEHLEKQLESAENVGKHAEALAKQVEDLERHLHWFKTQLFGAKSERRMLEALSPADQLWLGEQMPDLPDGPPAPDESPRETANKARAKARKRPEAAETDDSSRLKFDDSVPVEEVIVEDSELSALGQGEADIVAENVTYKLGQRSPYVVIRYIQRVWKKKGEEQVHKANMPGVVLERSVADVSFLAGMAVDKHCFHLPLYRQHQRLKHSGIHLDRSTLTRLNQRVAEMCDLVYTSQFSSILSSSVLAIDESPTPAGRSGGKMDRGYYWVFYGDKHEVQFVYSPTRSREVLDQLLEGFKGTLLSDGYKAYESFTNRTLGVSWAGCWAHTRRHFVEAERKEPEKVGAILLVFQQLYELEAKARGKPKILKTVREEQSRPIVDKLFAHFRDELSASALLPSNAYVKALEYAIKQERPLRVFLENPEVAIDTNHVERMIRPAVVGRKNWMFHSTEDGARNSGILYSLLQTCALHDINPRTYLIDILQRQDDPGAVTELFTPRLWKEHYATSPRKSAIDR